MTSRPTFSAYQFVRARRAFDSGNGPAEAWARITEISLWRLDELAEQEGCRTWSMLIAPVDAASHQDGIEQGLQHATRSGGLPTMSLPAFWRLSADRLAASRLLIVFGIEVQRTMRLARRYGQAAVVRAQRIPFEHVVVLDAVGDQRVEMSRYDPAAIADALARVLGADGVALVYRATSVGESQLIAAAEGRFR